VGIFTEAKNERNQGSHNGTMPLAKTSPDSVTTLGLGTLVTGNIVCEGILKILGRFVGDIAASHLVISEGAQVEGNVVAQNTDIQGAFKGIIHSNSVNLGSTAVVDGEICNKSLTITQNAQFEGISRRLDKQIDPPSIGEADTQNGFSNTASIPADKRLGDSSDL